MLPFIFYPMLGFGDAQYGGGRKKKDDYGDFDDQQFDDDRPAKKKDRSRDDYSTPGAVMSPVSVRAAGPGRIRGPTLPRFLMLDIVFNARPW